jgi:hypothetical protein
MAQVVVVWDSGGHELDIDSSGAAKVTFSDDQTREVGIVRPTADDVTLFASSAQSSGSGTGSIVNVGGYREGYVLLEVIDVSGTTRSLDVTIQTSPDQIYWEDFYSFPTQSQLGWVTKRFSSYEAVGSGTGPFGKYMRVLWSISGTGSPQFNFEVRGSFKT